jgi:hypothetical protein
VERHTQALEEGMDLKGVVAALLPFESRDHVLGDLEERGFRVRDVVNVLPLVWWSYWVRQWKTPAYVTAGASDAALYHRARQFARRQALFRTVSNSLGITLVANLVRTRFLHRPASDEPWTFFFIVFVGILINEVLERRFAPPAGDRTRWLKRHRGQLKVALREARLPLGFPFRILSRILQVLVLELILFGPPLSTLQNGISLTILLLALPVTIQWERRRKSRLQLELEHLPEA